jgi:hypothetical protein
MFFQIMGSRSPIRLYQARHQHQRDPIGLIPHPTSIVIELHLTRHPSGFTVLLEETQHVGDDFASDAVLLDKIW